MSRGADSADLKIRCFTWHTFEPKAFDLTTNRLLVGCLVGCIEYSRSVIIHVWLMFMWCLLQTLTRFIHVWHTVRFVNYDVCEITKELKPLELAYLFSIYVWKLKEEKAVAILGNAWLIVF